MKHGIQDVQRVDAIQVRLLLEISEFESVLRRLDEAGCDGVVRYFDVLPRRVGVREVNARRML